MSDIRLGNMDIITSMEDNMYHKLQYIPSKINTMHVDKIGDTLVVNSGLPSDTFNTAYGGKISQQRAERVMEYYLSRKMPMVWWIGPSSAHDENIEGDIESAGFVYDEYDVGMYCDLNSTNLGKYAHPDDLKVIQCNNTQDFLDFGDVLASIFNPTDEHVKMFYSKIQDIPQSARKNLVLFVGYVNGRPVSTSGLFVTDVAGIYDVSTRPEERERGYGSAMFYATMIYAKSKGLRIGVLQASSDGINIYKRFGYQEICEFHAWSNKKVRISL